MALKKDETLPMKEQPEPQDVKRPTDAQNATKTRQKASLQMKRSRRPIDSQNAEDEIALPHRSDPTEHRHPRHELVTKYQIPCQAPHSSPQDPNAAS